jgi:hypothetical protein
MRIRRNFFSGFPHPARDDGMNLIGHLRRLIPNDLKYPLLRSVVRFTPVRRRCGLRNVYHCCVHKTASQWIRRLLCDPRTYRYCGLRPFSYQQKWPNGSDPRTITARSFSRPFPAQTVVSPLYVDYANFRAVPKPGEYRAFFVMRDPRDIVVSWYFSTRYSHPLTPGVADQRPKLQRMDRQEGILFSIRHLAQYGLFEALRSWAEAPPCPAHKLVRFEDLVGTDGKNEVRELLEHCEIEVPDAVFDEVHRSNSLKAIRSGEKIREDKRSKYRRGRSGDWTDHFEPRVQRCFRETTGDLVEVLGYA